jgi:hypothetical protein
MEITGFDGRQFGTELWLRIINHGIVLNGYLDDSCEYILQSENPELEAEKVVTDALDWNRHNDVSWLDEYLAKRERICFSIFYPRDN